MTVLQTEGDLIERASRGDEGAMTALINAYAALIRRMAGRWRGFLETEDAAQELTVCLLRCVRDYDPLAGCALSTYFQLRAGYELKRLARKAGLVRIQERGWRALARLRREGKTVESLAETDVSPSEYRNAHAAYFALQVPLSFDAPVSPSADESGIHPDRSLRLSETVAGDLPDDSALIVADLMDRAGLSERKRDALRRHFWDGDGPTEIARETGVSRQAAHARIQSGLRAMRAAV